jgi:hypothetical protein
VESESEGDVSGRAVRRSPSQIPDPACWPSTTEEEHSMESWFYQWQDKRTNGLEGRVSCGIGYGKSTYLYCRDPTCTPGLDLQGCKGFELCSCVSIAQTSVVHGIPRAGGSSLPGLVVVGAAGMEVRLLTCPAAKYVWNWLPPVDEVTACSCWYQ